MDSEFDIYVANLMDSIEDSTLKLMNLRKELNFSEHISEVYHLQRDFLIGLHSHLVENPTIDPSSLRETINSYVYFKSKNELSALEQIGLDRSKNLQTYLAYSAIKQDPINLDDYLTL